MNTRDIIKATAEYFNIAPSKILTGGRKYADERHVAIAAALRTTKLSLNQLGRIFQKHHTTILHARNRVNATPRLMEAADIVADNVKHEVSNERIY